MFYKVSLTLACFVLIGSLISCATPEQREAYYRQQQIAQEAMMDNIMFKHKKECLNYGFKPETVSFAYCVQQLEKDRVERVNAANNANNNPWEIPQVNCYTYYIGNQAFTNCY
jgi:hypothetical protein